MPDRDGVQPGQEDNHGRCLPQRRNIADVGGWLMSLVPSKHRSSPKRQPYSPERLLIPWPLLGLDRFLSSGEQFTAHVPGSSFQVGRCNITGFLSHAPLARIWAATTTYSSVPAQRCSLAYAQTPFASTLVESSTSGPFYLIISIIITIIITSTVPDPRNKSQSTSLLNVVVLISHKCYIL